MITKTGAVLRSCRTVGLNLGVTLGLILGLATSAGAQQVDFKRWVLPILEKNCFDCHREAYRDERGKLRKPKAGLRLDGKGWILRGSDDQKVVVSGEPDDSSLYYLTVLEADDGDIMPEDGKPLSKRQTEILRLWISQGAQFGSWIGAVGPSAKEAKPHAPVAVMATPLFDRLGKGKLPLSSSAIKRVADKHAQVSPVVPGSPLLRIAFRSFEGEVGDAKVARLSGLAEHATCLDLSRSVISDRALLTVAKMKSLTRLDLHGTAISDRGVAAIEGLSELRYLNLYGTKITDRSMASLAALRQLKAVYLWKTQVSARAVAELRQKLPACRIVYEIDLPDSSPVRDPKERAGKRKKRKQL